MRASLQERFRERFGGTACLYRAPGRVNLIGEHTDYNDGFVMPVAIDLACRVAIGPRPGKKLVIYSENVDQSVELDLSRPNLHPSGGWSDYPVGVAVELLRSGYSLAGANLYIRGDIPLGGGLSSSAAVEVSVGYALLCASGFDLALLQLARLCQRAENEFVGARCGIMDQFTACHGQSGCALLLDCRSLEYRPLLLPEGIDLVVCNTKVKHELATNEYNLRRAECEEAVQRLSEVLPHVRALRDVRPDELETNRNCLTSVIYRRARHVVTENERVRSAEKALALGNIGLLGKLMGESHRSLRDDYEVSCFELDTMVEIAGLQRGVLGARMTGAGFGGCTINLVETKHVAEFQRQVAVEYLSATGHAPEILLCKASQGVEAVSTESQEAK